MSMLTCLACARAFASKACAQRWIETEHASSVASLQHAFSPSLSRLKYFYNAVGGSVPMLTFVLIRTTSLPVARFLLHPIRQHWLQRPALETPLERLVVVIAALLGPLCGAIAILNVLLVGIPLWMPPEVPIRWLALS